MKTYLIIILFIASSCFEGENNISELIGFLLKPEKDVARK